MYMLYAIVGAILHLHTVTSTHPYHHTNNIAKKKQIFLMSNNVLGSFLPRPTHLTLIITLAT